VVVAYGQERIGSVVVFGDVVKHPRNLVGLFI
jgi:hypothetical protein